MINLFQQAKEKFPECVETYALYAQVSLKKFLISTLFENYSKCRIIVFLILAFSTNLCPFKIDLSGNTV